MTLHLRILGTPAGQGSAKAYVVGGRARITNTNAKHRSWRTDIVEQTRTQLPDGFTPYTVPVLCALTFRQAPPKTLTKRERLLPPDRGIDIDKLVRACLDALSVAGVWDDDKRVTALAVEKRWADDRHLPGVEIRVAEHTW